MIDTHTHIYLNSASTEAILKKAADNGVEKIIVVGTDLSATQTALSLSQKHPQINATAGLHPCNVDDMVHWEAFKKLVSSGSFCALGEMGLDYYHMNFSKEEQAACFIKQLDLARELKLPVVIHNREADEDCLAILKAYPDIPRVFHCFSSGPSFVDKAMEISDHSYFSFTATITYSKKGKTIQSLKKLPLERIMIETDCPYIVPKSIKEQHPEQKIENEPAYVSLVAQRISEIKDIALADVINQTSQTATQFFKLWLF